MSARGAAINKSRQAKRERKILSRLRKGKKAGHGPMTRAARVTMRRR